MKDRCMRNYFIYAVFYCFISTIISDGVLAQTNIHITGAKAGFPIGLPQLCDSGSGTPFTREVPDVVASNLRLSGIFNVINQSAYVETPGKCGGIEQITFSDWSVIGAEALVKGSVQSLPSGMVRIELILYDVMQQKAVLGKGYECAPSDTKRIAHKFTNEIVKYFTGQSGVFGTQIAFVSKVGRFKEIFVMDLDGSNVRQLTFDKGLALSPAWSPSGDRIIYTSYKSRRPDLYVSPSSGGQPVRLTKGDGLEIGAEFSPDGRSIITSITQQGSTTLSLLDAQGGFIKRLTSSGAIDVSPSWSPDARQVAFCSNRGGEPQIYVMNADGTNPHRISFVDSNYCTSPSWSPTGDKVAFVCRDQGNQIYISAPDGQQTIQLTHAGNNEDPAWAPDGRSVVFSSSAGQGGARNIVLYSLIGNTTTRVTHSASEDSMPVWSPMFE